MLDPTKFFKRIYAQQTLVARNAKTNVSPICYEMDITACPEYDFYKDNEYHLAIGLNTMYRRKKSSTDMVFYLEDTIKSLVNQIELYYTQNPHDSRKILLFVQDLSGSLRVPFDNLKVNYSQRVEVILHKSYERFIDPFTDNPNVDYKSKNNARPSRRARQQNIDVINLGRTMLSTFNFQHFMFMEDDFEPCNGSFAQIMNMMNTTIEQDPNYCSISTSYGMNGIILPRMDLDRFLTYVSCHIDAYAIDILIRWYFFHDKGLLGANDVPLGFKSCLEEERFSYSSIGVLMEHVGSVSTFEERSSSSFERLILKCGDMRRRIDDQVGKLFRIINP
ncbi:hypothetical protein AKO1_012487 [Acrasis kona]|uniref:Uncharacterized protein n=1 Tax=Acrasis kona TaxID=1008807 RepID=A0AAW2YVX8_9EUKA